MELFLWDPDSIFPLHITLLLPILLFWFDFFDNRFCCWFNFKHLDLGLFIWPIFSNDIIFLTADYSFLCMYLIHINRLRPLIVSWGPAVFLFCCTAHVEQKLFTYNVEVHHVITLSSNVIVHVQQELQHDAMMQWCNKFSLLWRKIKNSKNFPRPEIKFSWKLHVWNLDRNHWKCKASSLIFSSYTLTLHESHNFNYYTCVECAESISLQRLERVQLTVVKLVL